ncbi:MAG: tRNA (adenosine(37)-N6)-threonylcarbamoyltransferase complex ATPase subunit type 1 TsaE [Gammaproteobacteria bacterium]|nr:tRNA (adenosine(37)-N6)-threonylcarbamoyltransferase complex ATPase subunit type 1 TsaE [Gammaproteobacteria bacterium]
MSHPEIVDIYLEGEEAMLAFGAELASVLDGARVHLVGDLGAGKTTLVRGILQAMGHRGAVKSPTYTLVEPYHLKDRAIYHFDLYRLGDPEELEYMGVRDYFEEESLCLVEWPDKGQGYLPESDLTVTIEYQGEARALKLEAGTGKGGQILSALAAKMQQNP